jgi:hypothetical protein
MVIDKVKSFIIFAPEISRGESQSLFNVVKPFFFVSDVLVK